MKQKDGWVYLLNQKLLKQNANYSIVNASISGETTGGGLSRLPGILSNKNVDSIIIELGGNDGLRGFPPKIIKNNLLQIIDIAHQHKLKVYLMDIRIPPNYGPRYNQLFIDVFKQVSTETNTPLLPFFMESIAVNPDLMQADGIHPNLKAQPLIVENMEKQLSKIFKG